VNRLSDITDYIPCRGAEFISDNEGNTQIYGTLNFIRPFRRAPEGLIRINPKRILTEYLMRLHFNIILKYTYISAEQWLQVKPSQNYIYIKSNVVLYSAQKIDFDVMILIIFGN
jgi:hypothetical protein